MNERIKELYAESVMSVHDAFIDRMLIPSAVDLQFAELIVKECIDTVQKRYMGDNNREDMEVRTCVQDLKQHFGVEE